MTSTLISSAAKSAFTGAVITKFIDSILLSKFNHKQEEKKWMRTTKLETFAQLSNEVICLNQTNFNEQSKKVTHLLSKIMLLIDDKKMIKNINEYLFIIEHYNQFHEQINLSKINSELLAVLSKSIRRS